MVLCALPALPAALPLVPRERLAASWEARLNRDFSEETGWPELVSQVMTVFRGLPADEQARTVILTVNYAEAAAIERYAQEPAKTRRHLPAQQLLALGTGRGRPADGDRRRCPPAALDGRIIRAGGGGGGHRQSPAHLQRGTRAGHLPLPATEAQPALRMAGFEIVSVTFPSNAGRKCRSVILHEGRDIARGLAGDFLHGGRNLIPRPGDHRHGQV